ncbi:MAG TPA: S24/S26 family peptidase [Terriglobales bacterium]|jgi:hypothetical protein|nr:S24/S26 family peptidase [Terriglobales bacterium]
MLEEIKSSARLSRSAEGSALIADALRTGGRFLDGADRFVRLKVYGESMLPTLWPGDVVEIAACSLEEIQPGDIVLAIRDGRLFLHRLVAAQPSGFVLRGDSVPRPDPLFPPEALLGRLVLSGHHIAEPRRRDRFRVSAKWSRAAGMLLCSCGVARRLALRLHSRGKASASNLRDPGAIGALASIELNSAGVDGAEGKTC